MAVAQRILSEELPAIPLWHEDTVAVESAAARDVARAAPRALRRARALNTAGGGRSRRFVYTAATFGTAARARAVPAWTEP